MSGQWKRRFLDLSIGGKSLLLLGAIGLLSTIGILVIQWQIAGSRRAIAEQVTHLETLEAVNRAVSAFDNLKYWYADLANSLSQDAEARASDNLEIFRETIAGNPALDQESRQTLIANADAIKKLSLAALDEYVMDERAAGNKLMNDARALVAQNDEILSALLTATRKRATDAASAVAIASSRAQTIGFVTLFGVLGCAGLTLLSTRRAVVAPIKEITSAMRQIAAGARDTAIPFTDNPAE
ncbi:MAG: hypothetical protein D6782_01200, partial [Alphaproteobacteria bacterium]